MLKINQTHIWYWKIQTARKNAFWSTGKNKSSQYSCTEEMTWSKTHSPWLPNQTQNHTASVHTCAVAFGRKHAKCQSTKPREIWKILPTAVGLCFLFPFSLLFCWIPALYFVSSEGFIPLPFLCLLLLYPDSATFKSWITVACATNKTFPQLSCFVNLQLKFY